MGARHEAIERIEYRGIHYIAALCLHPYPCDLANGSSASPCIAGQRMWQLILLASSIACTSVPARICLCVRPRPTRMAWDVIRMKLSNSHDVIRTIVGRFKIPNRAQILSLREQKHDESDLHGSCANELISWNNSRPVQRCSARTLEGNTASTACEHCWGYQKYAWLSVRRWTPKKKETII
jgi:hypothetical protein